jgi:hypothetical protein
MEMPVEFRPYTYSIPFHVYAPWRPKPVIVLKPKEECFIAWVVWRRCKVANAVFVFYCGSKVQNEFILFIV